MIVPRFDTAVRNSFLVLLEVDAVVDSGMVNVSPDACDVEIGSVDVEDGGGSSPAAAAIVAHGSCSCCSIVEVVVVSSTGVAGALPESIMVGGIVSVCRLIWRLCW